MIQVLSDKKVVLGVTGSIACYKAVDLASKLTQAGAQVDVILTESARRFVSPLAFRSVTGRPALVDMWDESTHVQHVNLGEEADLMVIAPATANTIARLANGMADNLLTLTTLSLRCPLLIAPAMDGGMYTHPATQANVAVLRERGVWFAGPAEGRMASGLSGQGRMVEPAELLGKIRQIAGRNGVFKGQHVVVTAGPTREALDPVRFITNRSTGKQGVALAQAAADAGATVTLVAGPMRQPFPVGIEVVNVLTTQEMHDATVEAVRKADILLMAAAVSDFRPSKFNNQKIKKTKAEEWGMAIGLERTLDILESVKAQRDATGRPFIVLGFAAETQNAFEYGRNKLIRKGLDIIAINDVTAEGAGFEVDTNRVILISSDGEVARLPLSTKTAVAEQIVNHLAKMM
ncbi:MAG: bifunctional phosphopantothenoylcysteine decarboxylase/phosphopantothenate--cysteine ligase CoaBC [Ardenticatenaceae bacterium]|nr:bifunctional phosphopantothenoylcysteine decarboxylase/phosphopantothenate--cysteine ligase CoaBC [Ardenticatenaceae bacterium]